MTTWPFIENGNFSSRFQFIDHRPGDQGYGTWNTTSSYAAAIKDTNLASLKDLGVEGAVPGKSGRVTFTTPDGASWIGLNVTRGPAFAQVVIVAEPKIEGYPPQTLTTWGEYYGPDELLWFRTLNPRVRYNISISPSPAYNMDTEAVALNSLTFYSDGAISGTSETDTAGPGTSSGVATSTGSKEGQGGPNIGAIVGGVVGGVCGLALLGALGWFILRRKRTSERRARQESEPKFEIEERPVECAPPTPFQGGLSAGVAHDAKGQVVALQQSKDYEPAEREHLLQRPRALDGGSMPDVGADVMDPPEYNPAWSPTSPASK